MRTSLLLLAAAAIATFSCAVAYTDYPLAGPYPTPWEPCEVNDMLEYRLGRWAVEQTHAVLSFDKVERARFQYTNSTTGNFELVIVASPRPGDPEKYVALVYGKPAMTVPIKLESFEHVRFRP